MKYKITKAILVYLLKKYGWITHNNKVSNEELKQIIREYQDFHGLTPDGWAGKITETHLFTPRICPHGDRMEINTSKNRWSLDIATDLKWGVTGKLKQFSLDEWKQIIQEQFDVWSEVCNVKAEYTNNPKTVNFVIGVKNIDGPSNVLGYAYLPQSNNYKGRLELMFDSSENWSYKNTRAGTIDIGAVVCHEIGHAKGLPHLSSGNLMQPTYSPNILRPQSGDVKEMVDRYGPPSQEPKEPDQPEEPDSPTNPDLETYIITGKNIQINKK